MSRICIIADTPYQLLNAINYYIQVERRSTKADLYVELKYESSKEIVKRIQQADLFDKVIFFENDVSEAEKNKNALYSIKRFIEVAIPRLRVKHCLKPAFTVCKNNYSKIICFSGIEFTIAMIRMNNNADVILLDEGNASVVSKNPLIDQYKRTMGKMEFIYRMAGLKLEKLDVSSLFLYNPSLYPFKEKEFEVKKLPSLNCNNELTTDIISMIFGGFIDDEYTDKHIIYLAQPLDNIACDYIDIEKRIAKVLKEYDRYSIVRVHPALKNINFYDIDIDKKQLMWELLCSNYVDEDSILIAYSSSAQLSPKTVYDKEPNIVFTYKLYTQTMEERSSCDQSVLNLKGIYRNQGKIYVPDSIDEFNNVLNRLG